MAKFLGCKIRITTDDGKYDGIVQSLDENNKRISLEKVVSCQSGKALHGILHFYSHEFKHVEQLEPAKSDSQGKEVDTTQAMSGPSVLHKKCQPSHLNKMEDLREPDLLLGKQEPYRFVKANDDDKPKRITLKRGEQFCLETPREAAPQRNPGLPSRPRHFVVIDQIDEEFGDVMIYLRKQQSIGLAMEGVKLGRSGKLCWVQVGTKEHIMLFDILTLGAAVFEQGLAEILENDSVLKVIHDCRQISDLLLHQYNVRLVNVFDTQVADVMVYRLMHEGASPRYVGGLASCLFSHLNLAPEDVFIDRYRHYFEEEDQSVWATRPCPDYVLDAAAKKVIYLKELRVVLSEKMMAEFVDGVNIYLESVRDATDEELKKQQVQPHLLPSEFNDLSKRVRSRRETQRDDKGFLMNCRGVIDPHIVYSHDSIWHKAKSDNTRILHKKETRPQTSRDGASRSDVTNLESSNSLSLKKPFDKLDIKSSDSKPSQQLDTSPKGTSLTEKRLPVSDMTDSDESVSVPAASRMVSPALRKPADIVLRPAGEMQYNLPKKKRNKPPSQKMSAAEAPSAGWGSDSQSESESVKKQIRVSSSNDSDKMDSFDDIPDLRSEHEEPVTSYHNNATRTQAKNNTHCSSTVPSVDREQNSFGLLSGFRGKCLMGIINSDKSVPKVGHGRSLALKNNAPLVTPGQFENAETASVSSASSHHHGYHMMSQCLLDDTMLSSRLNSRAKNRLRDEPSKPGQSSAHNRTLAMQREQ